MNDSYFEAIRETVGVSEQGQRCKPAKTSLTFFAETKALKASAINNNTRYIAAKILCVLRT